MHLAIVGNSAAALSALEAFRLRDRESRVTLISSEEGPAYSRVLLPYYLRGRLSERGLFIRTPRYYDEMDARTLFDSRVERVDVPARRLELADGRRLGFDRLLLATGSHPSKPPIPGLEGPRVRHLWTIADARRLDGLMQPGAHALVLGAGFVALQAAWAATRRGLRVTVVEIAEQILPRVLDDTGARLLHEEMVARGVAVHTGARTEGVEHDRNGGMRVHVDGHTQFDVDLIIVGAGIRPNAGLLPEAVEPGAPGFRVDAALQTAVEGVFAAGDVARGPVCDGGPPEIHALWPTAIEQGRVAGANLAGAGATYVGSLSMNVTEMFGVTVASLGHVVASPHDEVDVRQGLAATRYLKIVSRVGVPVGAVALGGPEAVSLLGRLRPFVRRRRVLPSLDALIEERYLSRLLATGTTGEDSIRLSAALPREAMRCASSS